MYEVIALCICTSCLSCICCFVTGALCMIPKLLQIRKDLGTRDGKIHKASGLGRNVDNNIRKIDRTKDCHDDDDLTKNIICKCPKKIIVHTLPIGEESICGLRKRDGCTCRPLRIDENPEWQ